MDGVISAFMLVTAAIFPREEPVAKSPVSDNWCTPGYKVMVPDGREGRVTSIDGDICRVLADGEAYVTLIPYYIVEPVYPQIFARHDFGR